ncbi:SDR family NAD(P)-dependent oxidoreductase [Reichenbachiella sp. MSK19-1]|uniref:SDR family NAD(P)-dependent oxidoreductase n=1 Tax=Reichenbachiella sp. MSK19-1 TaxID=1897631 RepID=UPI000E6D16E5|nr:SDR family NAD(P)-dependent oxidoreductase [Reichenbachiella sp. MSK19-1]RJE73932.1 hypothetical protein BGP76_12025 [Reichenbachiella sp. MSK19-1]
MKGNVLITGVSTGIGYYATKKFISEGYRVFGSVRKMEDADQLVERFGAFFRPLLIDVTDQEAIDQAAKIVTSECGDQGLQLLVNNSGIAVTGPVQCLTADDFRRQFEVNFFGLVAVTNAFLPLLGAQDGGVMHPGKIINISSVASRSGMPFMTPYGSSKAAVDAYSEGLRRELMLFGIDVVVLNPGAIKTPIWDKVEEPSEKLQQSPYGKSLMRFYQLTEREASGAIPVEALSELLFKTFTQRKPKTFRLVVRNKFLKYTLPRMFMSDRGFDKLLYKVLKMKP